jgi:hypothetical protein
MFVYAQESGRVNKIVNAIKRQSLIRQQWWIQRKLMNVGVRLMDTMQASQWTCVCM